MILAPLEMFRSIFDRRLRRDWLPENFCVSPRLPLLGRESALSRLRFRKAGIAIKLLNVSIVQGGGVHTEVGSNCYCVDLPIGLPLCHDFVDAVGNRAGKDHPGRRYNRRMGLRRGHFESVQFAFSFEVVHGESSSIPFAFHLALHPAARFLERTSLVRP